MEELKAFTAFANTKGFEAALIDTFVIISNVIHPENDFKLMKVEDNYTVVIIRVSSEDYIYAAKCEVYMLLAEFNQSHGRNSQMHINYKVDL